MSPKDIVRAIKLWYYGVPVFPAFWSTPRTCLHTGRFRKLFFKRSSLHCHSPVLIAGLHFSLVFDHYHKTQSRGLPYVPAAT